MVGGSGDERALRPHVKWGKVNATLPRDMEPGAITMEQALELITAKASKSGKKPAKKPAAKTAAKTAAKAEKAPGEKPAAKKPAAKKPAAKKSRQAQGR